MIRRRLPTQADPSRDRWRTYQGSKMVVLICAGCDRDEARRFAARPWSKLPPRVRSLVRREFMRIDQEERA